MTCSLPTGKDGHGHQLGGWRVSPKYIGPRTEGAPAKDRLVLAASNIVWAPLPERLVPRPWLPAQDPQRNQLAGQQSTNVFCRFQCHRGTLWSLVLAAWSPELSTWLATPLPCSECRALPPACTSAMADSQHSSLSPLSVSSSFPSSPPLSSLSSFLSFSASFSLPPSFYPSLPLSSLFLPPSPCLSISLPFPLSPSLLSLPLPLFLPSSLPLSLSLLLLPTVSISAPLVPVSVLVFLLSFHSLVLAILGTAR